VKTVHASGLDALQLVTKLLHRVRLIDPEAGIWEAADFQWWWRMPRRSDSFAQRFVVDDRGPVAAAIATEWRQAWGLDPVVVPSSPGTLRRDVFLQTLGQLQDLVRSEGSQPTRVESMVRDDDRAMIELVQEAGFAATDNRGGNTAMAAEDRPALAPLPAHLALVDRSMPNLGPHPMIARSGPVVEERLRQVSLYDPWLDLALRTPDGATAAYSLFWFDPVTRLGYVEPMRVEDAWQRRGLGRALLSRGIARLVERGATRVKVGWGSPPGRNLYLGTGFVETATTTTYERSLN
jgi:GNAT superfamily N-acetyltransferase